MKFDTNQNTFETNQLASTTLSIMLKVSTSMIKGIASSLFWSWYIVNNLQCDIRISSHMERWYDWQNRST
ncbi:hypothetical protein BHE74_00052306 [Ensete ventricosum]|uniref:Uncharacterized protein n=1 Tax=Ensete ventricosum TaxID=4639 RepID=A0A444G4R9_ENSVE|nr:hypothetical protein GW17_00005571 [Ensete ventricosum]RWW42158.1 hypothetical protein BHE74_00052306 [Ensete ventricosum]RZR75207.1 hypothetical protein BHM03_00051920 [Ensete ventricosum]